ncbi:hypothetical protein GCM10022288_20960 [Gryllotalpicola kribbensis]|jgi:hypothetical protein|uniref:Alkaline shock response membrane anchor protein AmaP n=1 Tax=Gryllotalpicola kribbensis TaxID=993084 RepID=A0ABP8AUJ7_9MICO
MTSQASVYRRIVRRETHSSRAGAAITVAVVIMLLAVAAGGAAVYAIVHPPLWAGIQAGFRELAGFRSTVRYALLAAGIVAGLLGILLVILAVAPGRRPRRRVDSSRAAVAVDDKVIARTLAKKGAEAAGVSRAQLSVVVARRRAAVHVTPTAGVSIDRSAVEDAVLCAGASYGLTRRPRVVIAEKAVVG